MGTISPDIITLDAKRAAEEGNLIEAAEVLKKELLDSGFGDRDMDMKQRGYPNVDTKPVSKQIKVLSKYFDEGGGVLAVWEKREVIVIPVMKEIGNNRKLMGNRKNEGEQRNKTIGKL